MINFIKKAWQGIRNKVVPYSIGVLTTAASVTVGAYYAIPGVVLGGAGIIAAVMWYGGEKNKEVASKLVELADNNAELNQILMATETGAQLLNQHRRELVTIPDNEPTSTFKINRILNLVTTATLITGTTLIYCYKGENESFSFKENSIIDEISALVSGVSVIGAGFNHFFTARKLRSYTNDLEGTQTILKGLEKTQLHDELQQAQQLSNQLNIQLQQAQQQLTQLNTNLRQEQQQSNLLRVQLQQAQDRLTYANQMKNNYRTLMNITKHDSEDTSINDVEYSSHSFTM